VTTVLYLLLSLLAGLAFYLACAHQRLRPALRARKRTLRIAASVLTVLAVVAAVVGMGPWAGVFAVLTALMLVLVALPYFDAWRQLRAQAANRRLSDVG
jgi:uncharacterized membrane protein